MSLKMRTLEAVRSLSSLFSQAGLMFGGARNIYAAYGYNRNITYELMLAKYERQDIAKRIIDMPAAGCWSQPPKVTLKGGGQKVFDALTDKYGLWNIFNRADKLAGMGAYATILVGVSDGKSLETPLTPNSDLKILYLQPYAESHLVIESLELDNKSPRFGKPLFYTLKRPSFPAPGPTSLAQVSMNDRRVHFSRVIHIAENVLENDIYGVPRMGNVYNLLEDLLKVGGGSAEVYWLNARAGMQVDIDKEMQLQPEDEAALSDEIDEYTNNMRRVIRTRGIKVNMLNATMGDPRMTFSVTISLISAATGIPQRILVGAEAGQLASAQDRANWASAVEERRTQFAEPNVLKPFFQWMVSAGLMKEESLLGIEYDWPEAFKLSPLERAQTSAQQARAAANFSKVLQQTPQLLAEDDMRSIISLAAPGDVAISAGVGETVQPAGPFGQPANKGDKSKAKAKTKKPAKDPAAGE